MCTGSGSFIIKFIDVLKKRYLAIKAYEIETEPVELELCAQSF